MKQIRLKNETLKIDCCEIRQDCPLEEFGPPKPTPCLVIDPKSLKEFLKFLEAEKEIELLKEGRNWEWDEEMQEEIQDPPYDPLTDEELNRLIEEFNKRTEC